MAKIRQLSELPGELLPGLVDAYNATNAALAASGALPHHDTTGLVTEAAAADATTAVALVNDIKAQYVAHIADESAHVAADETNSVAAADATDSATAITLANEAKADFNAHIALAASHRGVSGAGGVDVPTISTSDATDATTLNTLANALKAAMNRHFAMGAPDIELVAS